MAGFKTWLAIASALGIRTVIWTNALTSPAQQLDICKM
jgi:hypothetical protein